MLSYLIFLSMILTISMSLHYFVWTKLFAPNKKILWIFLCLGVLGPLSYGLFRKALWLGPFATILISWNGVLLLTTVFISIGYFLNRGISPLVNPSRRDLLKRGLNTGALVGTGMLTFHGVNEALGEPRVKVVNIPIKNWPKEYEGFRIIQISDLHVGITIEKPFVEKVVEICNSIKPEMVLLTGDLVDGDVDGIEGHVRPLFDLKSTHGIFASLGNHEYYSGALQWTEYFSKNGIPVLRNESKVISVNGVNIFNLAGVDDWNAKRWVPGHGYDLTKALEDCDKSLPTILMAHQPKGADEALSSGVDLQLSGHTHGGQIWPFSYLVGFVQPYVKGLHKVGDSHIYVSSGTGFWGPAIRVRTQSEITVIKIQRA